VPATGIRRLSGKHLAPAALSPGWRRRAKSSLGDAESSLGDAKSSLGDAKSSLVDAKSSLGDAESRVEYDATRVSYEQLLDVFFSLHDPSEEQTAQYRSAIWPQTDAQQAAAQAALARTRAASGTRVRVRGQG
jgi:hypothetical protein